MNKTHAKLAIIIGNILTCIGCFLPFISLFNLSMSFIEGDGILVVILSVVAIIIALFKPKFAFIPNALSLFITIHDMINIADISSTRMLAIGAYVILIGTIVAIVGSILALIKKL